MTYRYTDYIFLFYIFFYIGTLVQYLVGLHIRTKVRHGFQEQKILKRFMLN
jgi:hypothetical protein